MRSEADKVVVVDLDGPLAKYDGWTGQFEPIGDPITDVNGWSARDFMIALQRRGYRTIVYSSRGDTEAIQNWLQRHGIPYNAVNGSLTNFPGESGKPPASAYVDDRAVRFAGNYQSALARVIQMAGASPPAPLPRDDGLGERRRDAGTATAEQDGQDTETAAEWERQTPQQDGQDTEQPIDVEVSPAGEASLIAAKLRDLARELRDVSSREKMLLAEELQIIEDRIEENADRIVDLQHERDHWREMAERLDDEDVFGDGG